MFFHAIDMFSNRLENKKIDWSSITRAWGQRGVLTFRQSVTSHWRHASHLNAPWITLSQARYHGKKLTFDRWHLKCLENYAARKWPLRQLQCLHTQPSGHVWEPKAMASLLCSLEQCCDCVGLTPLGFISQAGWMCPKQGLMAISELSRSRIETHMIYIASFLHYISIWVGCLSCYTTNPKNFPSLPPRSGFPSPTLLATSIFSYSFPRHSELRQYPEDLLDTRLCCRITATNIS